MAGSGPESWNVLRRRRYVWMYIWSGEEVRGNEARNGGSRQFVEGPVCQAKEFRMYAVIKGSQISILTEQ